MKFYVVMSNHYTMLITLLMKLNTDFRSLTETRRELLKKMKIRSKSYYDRKELNIKINDLVKVNKEPYNKLGKIKDGTFRVVDINPPNATIELKNGKNYIIHCNRLTKYNIDQT